MQKHLIFAKTSGLLFGLQKSDGLQLYSMFAHLTCVSLVFSSIALTTSSNSSPCFDLTHFFQASNIPIAFAPRCWPERLQKEFPPQSSTRRTLIRLHYQRECSSPYVPCRSDPITASFYFGFKLSCASLSASIPYKKAKGTLTVSCIQRERRKAGKRNQLSVKFDGDMAGAERKMDELLKTAAEESYVSPSRLLQLSIAEPCPISLHYQHC